MAQDKHIIVGAGIIGLYTAFSLIDKGVSGYEVTVVAQYLPGDQSVYYSSPWAGGNFSCISPEDSETLSFDEYTYTNLQRLQSKLGGPYCGLDILPTVEYWKFQPAKEKIDSLRSYLKDFRTIPSEKLPSGVVYGVSFSTWNFNCPKFLENLQYFLESKGVVFLRKEIKHIDEVATLNTRVTFNCTGIGACKLGGVQDSKVYPVRGQVVVIRAPHVNENYFHWGKDSATYIIPRPFSSGQVVLGGFIQKNVWTGDTFKFETEDILRRTCALHPKILEKPLDIIRVASGLRPYREGGARIEKTRLKNGQLVIHNYGAGGYGFQAGFGMADRACKLFFSRTSNL